MCEQDIRSSAPLIIVPITRVGSVLIRLRADGPVGVRRSGVTALTERHGACQQVSEECEPVPMHEALRELMAR